MKIKNTRTVRMTALIVCMLLGAFLTTTVQAQAIDPLPSWNDGPAKQSILSFVKRVTTPGADFVPLAERIAVFDNDGTLWAEQPMYFQFIFALSPVKALAPQHPEWQTTEPFASLLKGAVKSALAGGEKAMLEIVMATHAGMTSEEFDQIVSDWLASAKHPKTGRLFTEMVYQPMLEVLAYFRSNGFKTYIVTGGGIEFVRVFSERVYGIPPQQIIGSSGKARYVFDGGTAPNWAGSKPPALIRLPELNFIDDKSGKPVGIQMYIGRRPIAAFGNSDGDKEMLEWTAAGQGPRFMGIVHHTDADREWAYDRQSHVGQLDRALDEAQARNWTVVDMKKDWNRVFPF